MLFLYAAHRGDPVIMVGQLTGLFIYARNIWLIWMERRLQSEPAGLRAAAK
jgi:lipid-A-disaccharide synthase-like uncharacterized protein